MLVESRWRYVRQRKTIQSFLDALGIEYRPGLSFWDSNGQQLPEIFEEIVSCSRDKLRELHPDTGGDGHEFGDFVEALSQVKKLFARRGVFPSTESKSETVKFRPIKDQKRARRQREYNARRKLRGTYRTYPKQNRTHAGLVSHRQSIRNWQKKNSAKVNTYARNYRRRKKEGRTLLLTGQTCLISEEA